MAPTTVKQFRADERDRWATEVVRLEGATLDAGVELTARQEDLELAKRDVQEKEAEESRIRQNLATAETPAEADGLADELEAVLLLKREARAAWLTAAEQVAVLGPQVTRLSAALDAAKARLGQASTDAAAVAVEAAALQRLRSALDGAQLQLVVDGATAAQGDPMTDATERLALRLTGDDDADSKAFVTLLARRREDATAELQRRAEGADRAVTELDKRTKARKKLESEVSRTGAAFIHKVAEVDRVVNTSAPRLAAAIDRLTITAALPPLGEDDADQLEDTAEAATASGALDDETGVYDKRDTERTAWKARDLDVLSKRPDDPGYMPPAGAWDTAADEAQDAWDDFVNGTKDDLDRWEVAVPSALWAAALAAVEAMAVVDELADLDPATLKSELDAAEVAYAKALDDEAAARWAVERAGTEAAQRREAIDALAASAPDRMASLVRGDV